MKVYFQTTIKILFTVLLLLIFLAGGIFIVFTFADSSFDTTSITNVGFAIFAGCASVCFAWSRVSETAAEKVRIRQHGESLFLSALCFVIASLSKYIFIHRKGLIGNDILEFFNFLFPVINVLGTGMFFLAYINAWISMLGLLKILFRKTLMRI